MIDQNNIEENQGGEDVHFSGGEAKNDLLKAKGIIKDEKHLLVYTSQISLTDPDSFPLEVSNLTYPV